MQYSFCFGGNRMKPEVKTLSAQVHDKILEMIIDEGAASENLLLTERELVEKFGVSKAPVREALLRLCAEEVLTSIPRCGYVVVRLGEKSGQDNLAVRQMLELSSLDRYFDAFTPEIIDSIQHRLCLTRQNLGDDPTIWQVWQANLVVHCDLIAVSDNPYLVKHLRNCIEVERRFYAQNHFLAQKRFLSDYFPEAHQHILDAIRTGDRALALKRLRADIAEGPNKYEQQKGSVNL